MENNPLVTVNILSFNRKDELRNTLTKVYEQDYKNIEVIVVDNASLDGSADMVASEFPEVILIRLDKNIGIAGWNKGFEIAKGEYVLVLDDDSYPERDAIGKGVYHLLTDNRIGIIAYRIFNNYFNEEETLYFYKNINSFIGCGALLTKNLIQNVGYFNEILFIYHHEMDYSLRSLQKEYIIYYLENATVIHNQSVKGRGSKTINPLINNVRYYYYFRNLFIIQLLYFNGYELLRNITRLIVNKTLICLSYLYWKEYLKAILSVFFNIKNIYKIRSPVNINIQKSYRIYYGFFDYRYSPFWGNLIPKVKSFYTVRKNRIKNTIAFLLFFLLKYITKIVKRNKKEGILIVNHGYLGELVVSTVVFQYNILHNYRKKYFLLDDKNEQLLKNNVWDLKTFPINTTKYKKNFLYRLKTIISIRKMGFEDCLNLNYNKGFAHLFEIAAFSGCERKFTLNFLSNIPKTKYKKNILKEFKNIGNHNTLNYVEAINKLVIDVYKLNNNKYLYPNLDYLFNSPKTKDFNFTNDKYICISPISSHEEFDWPLLNYYNLSKLIYETFKYKVIFMGTIEQHTKIQYLISNDNGMINMAGNTDIITALYIIKRSKLFIGNDSGLTHIAKAINKEFIAIIGGHHYGAFFPYFNNSDDNLLFSEMECFGCERQCIHNKPLCVTNVAVEEVFHKVKLILGDE